MADDFDALRSIRGSSGDLDPDRAARMRARALASAFGEPAREDSTGTLLTEAPTDRRPTGAPEHAGRSVRRDRADHIVRLAPNGPAVEIHLDQPDRRREPDDADHRTDGVRTGRRPFVVMAAAAAVLAVIIGAAVARSGERSAVVADQPAPTSVAEIAANASTLVDRPLGPGEYAYLSVSGGLPFTDLDGTEQTHVKVRDTWISGAGDGRERISATDIVDGSGRSIGTFDEAVDSGPTAKVAGFGAFGYDRLRTLPTDPAQLRAVLDSGEFAHVSARSRSYLIADLLMLDATPPGVRAAALTILAEDGATLIGDVTDHDGRTGLGIVATRPDGFTSVYVVSRDGLLVGSYDIITGDTLHPDRAVLWSSLIDQRRVTGTD